MGRNYLAHRAGDAVNAVLAAAGYNFHLLLRWLELLLSNFRRLRKQRPRSPGGWRNCQNRRVVRSPFPFLLTRSWARTKYRRTSPNTRLT